MAETKLAGAIKLSESQLSRLTSQVEDHRDEALASRDDFPLRHSDRYRRFLADPMLRPPGPWPEAPRFFVPITRAILERLHAEIFQALFSNLAQITLNPFGEEDLPKADFATKFLQWTLRKTLDFQGTASTLLFDALLDSVGVAKVMTYSPPWKPPSADQRRYLSRTVRIDPLDLGMFLVAPDAESLQYPECRYVAQEFFLCADDIARMRKAGFDTPDYDQLGHSQELTDRKRVELEREGHNVVDFKPDSIYFVESYERFDIDDDDLEEDVIVSWFPDALTTGTSHKDYGRIAGVRLLTDVFPQDDRPRRPFFPVTIWPQPRQWRGLNVPDRLETMQDLINRLHEQCVNYGDVSMLPFIFANTFLTGELPDLRTVRPGSTVPIDDINGVQFAPTRSLNRHFSEQISLAMSNIERDTNVTDFNLGRQPDRPNAPRTASATLAILGESRKSYSMLIRHNATQFASLLTFYFRLWQETLPPVTFAQVGDIPAQEQNQELSGSVFGDESLSSGAGSGSGLFDRLFEQSAPSPNNPKQVAVAITKEQLSGFYDVTLDINPEEAFDRQVMISLFQLLAPLIQDYPLGMRFMMKRIWGSFDQHGFDEIFPEWLAALQTQQRMLAAQVQLAALEGQLSQLQAAEQQQALLAQQGGLGGLGGLLGQGGPPQPGQGQGSGQTPNAAQAAEAAGISPEIANRPEFAQHFEQILAQLQAGGGGANGQTPGQVGGG